MPIRYPLVHTFHHLVEAWLASDDYHVGGLRPLWAIGNLELHLLTFGQVPTSRPANARIMDEYVFTIPGRDESVPFGFAEPLYFSGSHSKPPLSGEALSWNSEVRSNPSSVKPGIPRVTLNTPVLVSSKFVT